MESCGGRAHDDQPPLQYVCLISVFTFRFGKATAAQDSAKQRKKRGLTLTISTCTLLAEPPIASAQR